MYQKLTKKVEILFLVKHPIFANYLNSTYQLDSIWYQKLLKLNSKVFFYNKNCT